MGTVMVELAGRSLPKSGRRKAQCRAQRFVMRRRGFLYNGEQSGG